MNRRSRALVGTLAWVVLAAADFSHPSVDDPSPPTDWDAVAWSASVADSTLSSPVVHGELVLLTSEPTWLHAIDLRTGVTRWSRDHPVTASDATPSGDAQEAQALQARLDALQEELSGLRREVRAGRATKEDAEPLRAEADTIQARLDTLAPVHTPPRGDMLGYAVPTPSVDGRGVVAAFGNGMVAAYGLDGTARWSRWLGVGVAPDRGYRGTDTASVLVHHDLVVVAHGRLFGLDRATGTVRWTGPAYLDYGTPAAMSVGSRTIVLTPAGHAIDGASGQVLREGLAEVFYTGPAVEGTRAWWAGRGDAALHRSPHVWGWTFAQDDADGLEARALFDVELPARDRVYATPVVTPLGLAVVTVRGSVFVLDPLTGEVVHRTSLEGGSDAHVWATPQIAEGALWISTRGGTMFRVVLQEGLATTTVTELPASVARPAWLQGGVVVRSDHGLERRGSALPRGAAE